jgi:type I restriction enzyme S subunit
VSDLPPGWEWATLGEIASSVKNGIFVSRPGADPDGVPILRISAVRAMQLNLNDVRYSKKSFGDLLPEGTLLEPGDLLFTRYSGNPDYVGACARVPEGIGDLTYPDKLIRVRLSGVDSRYVAAVFASPTVRASINSVLRTTAGQVGISGSALKGVRVPVPPLAEQWRIVTALEDHLSRLEAGRVALARAEQMLSRYKSSLLARLLSDANGNELPIGQLLAEGMTNGRSVPTRESGFPVLRLTSLKDGRIDLQASKGGAWSEREARPYLVKTNDFLVSRGNGSIALVGRGGLVGPVSSPTAFPDTMIRFRSDTSRLDPRFLSLVWSSSPVRRQIESKARTTAGIYKVNQKILEAVSIPVPSLPTQRAIVSEFDELSRTEGRLAASIKAGCRLERQLCRSLLADTFAGRLVPQDPTDEPAAVLLERIRAERDAQPKPKRARRTARHDPAQEPLT